MSQKNIALNAYHQEESLNFQFLLAELLRAFEHLEAIREIGLRLAEKKLELAVSLELLQQLGEEVRELGGSTPDFDRLYSWDAEYGVLTKLKHYWMHFREKNGKEEKKGVSLERLGSRTWLLCMEILDTVRLLHYSSSISHAKRMALVEKLEKLDRGMRRFAVQMLKWMDEFSDDEHVIYYLIRHRPAIDRIFGKGYVAKRLKKMHPKGLPGICRLLVQRYKKRGFQELVPYIESQFEHLRS